MIQSRNVILAILEPTDVRRLYALELLLEMIICRFYCYVTSLCEVRAILTFQVPTKSMSINTAAVKASSRIYFMTS